MEVRENSEILVPRAGVEPAPPFGERILSPGYRASLSLTKRYEAGCTRQAVDKVSLRLVSYQQRLLSTYSTLHRKRYAGACRGCQNRQHRWYNYGQRAKNYL